jgi:hypothetical protein
MEKRIGMIIDSQERGHESMAGCEIAKARTMSRANSVAAENEA